MSPETRHPHIDRPSTEQLVDLLHTATPEICDLYLQTHQLVLETIPDVAYSVDCKDGQMGYGARQYGYSGWGMAALSAHAKWVSLMFMFGAHLEDRDGLLEGTGKNVRHIKLRSLEQLEQRRSALRALIEAATRYFEG